MIATFDNDTDALLYDQIVQLEGYEYLFRFYWSERESCWYMDMTDQDHTPIALGIKLVIGVNLFRRFSSELMPGGELYLFDLTNNNIDIQKSDELGERCQLFYFSVDEIG